MSFSLIRNTFLLGTWSYIPMTIYIAYTSSLFVIMCLFITVAQRSLWVVFLILFILELYFIRLLNCVSLIIFFFCLLYVGCAVVPSSRLHFDNLFIVAHTHISLIFLYSTYLLSTFVIYYTIGIQYYMQVPFSYL